MYDQPYDSNGVLLGVNDWVTFGSRRYLGFKYARVVAVDLGGLVLEMKSKTRTLKTWCPASWVTL